jgi:hypothetical protein
MELRCIRSGRKFNADNWGDWGLSVVLGQPLSNLCGSHADDRVVRGVIIGASAEHLHADHALTKGVRLSRQGVVHNPLEKLLTALAAGERIAGNHRLERAAN